MTTITEPTTFKCPNCATIARINARRERDGYNPLRRGVCDCCFGAGEVTVDPDAIREAITNSRGANKGTLRASRPALQDPTNSKGVYGAAYVWRMIRFHNGDDMHMPVVASMYVGITGTRQGDEPQLCAALDGLVDSLGEELSGKVEMMRGVARWGRALGFPGADDVHAAVDAAVGVPSGAGVAIGDSSDSPEAALEGGKR